MASLDKHYMGLALDLAKAAFVRKEVPVGAVIVVEGQLSGWGFNQRMQYNDVLGHAEIAAIQCANRNLGNWQLRRSTMYVSLEPCLMCAGAILQARIDRLVFACRDPKAGAVRSLYACVDDPRLPHRVRVAEGCRADESSALLREFFENMRTKK
ncbi:MAG: nucleoside deaminase [Bradymonadales bacterium]|jgi:tRNA(adenine34) deaminase